MILATSICNRLMIGGGVFAGASRLNDDSTCYNAPSGAHSAWFATWLQLRTKGLFVSEAFFGLLGKRQIK